jgi:protein-S-isoprenylcysteine O-methyltransferase Ste14
MGILFSRNRLIVEVKKMSYAVKIKIAIFFIALVIFGVIFISWGVDDIKGLLAHPARAALLLLLLAQLLVIMLLVPLGWMSNRLLYQPVDDNHTLIAFIGAMGVLLFLMVSPFSDRREWMLLSSSDAVRYFGLFLFVIGVAFSTWATIHLCRRLSFQVKNQQGYKLVTDGPFKIVRHPRDFGSILIFVGIPLVFLSSLGLVLAFLSTAGLFERISREERMLQQQFKEEWSQYVQKTKCMIPWA